MNTMFQKVPRIFVKSLQIVPLISILINGKLLPVITKDMKLEVPHSLTESQNVDILRNFSDIPTEEQICVNIKVTKSDLISFKTTIGNYVQTDFYKFGFKIQEEEEIKSNAHYLGSCYHVI